MKIGWYKGVGLSCGNWILRDRVFFKVWIQVTRSWGIVIVRHIPLKGKLEYPGTGGLMNKKQLEMLASDKRFKLYDGSRGINRLMTVEELEVLRQSFTPAKFKAIYLNEYQPDKQDRPKPEFKTSKQIDN